MAVTMAVIGGLVLVLGLFDTLGRLRTPSARESVDEFLGQPPGNTLGFDTAQVIEMLRGLTFVSGALAAMGLVFAIYIMQRHRGARIGFTVVAALLVLTIPVAGLMPFFFAVAALLLWSQPARDWYVGRAPVAAAAGGGRAAPLMSHAAEPPGSDQTNPQPSQPQPGYPPPYGQQAPYGQDPYGQPYPGQQVQYGYPVQGSQQSGRDPEKRPLTVTLAAILTWVGAGCTALLMLAFMLILGSGGDSFVEEFDKAARESDVSLTSDQILTVGWVIAATLLLWSLISMVVAIFAVRRSNGARWTLVVSAIMAALFSLLAILSILSAVTLILAVATAIMLFTGGANEWYARRSASSGQPPQPPYGGYPQYAGPQYPEQQYPEQQQPAPQYQAPQYPQQPDYQPPEKNKPW